MFSSIMKCYWLNATKLHDYLFLFLCALCYCLVILILGTLFIFVNSVTWFFMTGFVSSIGKIKSISTWLILCSKDSLNSGFVILNRWQILLWSILIISFHSLYIFREKYKLPKCYSHYMPAYYLIMSSGLETTKWGPVWVNQNTQHLKVRVCNKKGRYVCRLEYWR